MEKNPLVSIIILNFNAGDLLVNCIESIKKSNYSNYEIILVDNASTDNSITLCKTKFPKITYIQNDKNLGYSEGNNIGVHHAQGDYIAILNPDTLVKPDWLDELILGYRTFGEGLYQPKLLSIDDKTRINTAGNMVQLFGFGFSRGKGEKDTGQYDSLHKIGFASGACLFTAKTVFDKLGGFEPFLFAYNEDMDLGWRAAKIGIDSYFIASAVVYHAESYSHKWSATKFFLLEQNRLYCILTHYSLGTRIKLAPFFVLTELALLFYFASKKMLKQKIRAYSSIIRNKKYIAKKRVESEKYRMITDRELIKRFVDKLYVPEDVSSRLYNKIFNAYLSFQAKIFRVFVNT